MTPRYDLLLHAIQSNNNTITTLAIFAGLIVIAYHALAWTPQFIRRPARYLYLAAMLIVSLLTTVYFGL